MEIVTKHVNNLCILVIFCNWLIFSHWQWELGPCRTSTSFQIGSCSNQVYNRSYCSDLFNHTQVYIIAENMEKALNIWRNIQSRINAGDSAKMLPTRAEVAALYKINYKTFCHRVNGRTAAKGHASGGARRGRIFTVGKYIIFINICNIDWYFLNHNKNSVLAGPPHLFKALHTVLDHTTELLFRSIQSKSSVDSIRNEPFLFRGGKRTCWSNLKIWSVRISSLPV